MVFHDDVEWRKNFLEIGRSYTEDDAMQHVRYRSWGTEPMLIDLVRKNMPWLRNIYIILAQESQKQPWMDEKGVTVVYHKDFIPDHFLPTFNSRAIEMFLKDIPGLSDMFLYGNDDMYPLKPLSQEDFFVDGMPCLHMTEKPFPANANNFQTACRCGLNFVAREFGIRYRTTWLKTGHSIAPILKSTCEYLWRRSGNEIEASVSPTRQRWNFNQYIYSWWNYLAGEYVDKVPSRKYVNVRKSVDEVADTLRNSDASIVCVNDHECAADYRAYSAVVRDILESKIKE